MKQLGFIAIILLLIFYLPLDVDAQCAMCKASAETSMADGSTHVAGLNKGVLYLFFAPYVIIATIGYVWYSQNKKKKLEAEYIDPVQYN